jgi:hypothetical protein
MPQIECLLLSNDSEVQRVVNRVSDNLGMSLESLPSVWEGVERLRKWRFDAVILDSEENELREILREIRKGKRNRTCIALAIVKDPNSGAAFTMGATFVLAKPVGMERFSRLMHAAHSLIVRQRLRYHRHSVQIPAKLDFGSVRDFPVTITNLSEGGAEIVVEGPVVINGAMRMRFTLPESVFLIDGKGELVWADAQGRAGIRFVHPLTRGNQPLRQWLAERIQPEDLGMVAKKK